jgi:hypothetical protein
MRIEKETEFTCDLCLALECTHLNKPNKWNTFSLNIENMDGTYLLLPFGQMHVCDKCYEWYNGRTEKEEIAKKTILEKFLSRFNFNALNGSR